MEKVKRVIERWVEVKVGNPEHIYNINGVNLIPLSHIGEFTDYNRATVRGFYNQKRIDARAVQKVGNQLFIRRDYVPALQMMYNDPEKYSRQKYMIDIYFEKQELK